MARFEVSYPENGLNLLVPAEMTLIFQKEHAHSVSTAAEAQGNHLNGNSSKEEMASIINETGSGLLYFQRI